MEHLNMQTPEGAQLNLDALYKICPSVFTEGQDANGKLSRKVNWQKLRELLGDHAEDNAPESYDFTWVGKRAAQREAAAPINKTLRPCPEESVDWENTQNLYIEGDNLEVLKLLQNSYMGKVKMIYIDPPYNTGNDFVYHDDFSQSADEYDEHNINEEGERYRKNTDSNGRFHSDWCSMMYARLMVARSLLTEDGVIFISIDDNECDNLCKICNEVFGEVNFVANISWQRTYSPRNNSTGVPLEVEHLLCFSKNPDWTPNKLPRTAEMDARYDNPDNDYCSWKSVDANAPGAISHQGMVYAIQSPFNGRLIYPAKGRCWCFAQEDVLKIMSEWGDYELIDIHDEAQRSIICGVSESEVRKGVKSIMLVKTLDEAKAFATLRYNKGSWPKFYFTKNGQGGIARKTYLDSVDGRMPTNYWPYTEVGHTDEAKKELMKLFDGENTFDTPKPVRLMSRLLNIATKTEDIVLDFFSGSATLAHATIHKNSEEEGCRRFILIQIPEKADNPKYPTLCEIGKERIRRAGAKIKAENPNVDTGFRVFKCDTSNMKDVYFHPNDYSQDLLAGLEDNIKEDRTDLDLLFDCMLRWGVELSLPLSQKKVGGCTIHNVNDGDLVACFDGKITEAVIDEIAATNPLRVVFRDSSFEEASEKMNLFELFKQKCQWSEQEVKNNVRVI